MNEDEDLEYKRNVRSTSIILIVIVLVILLSLLLPPILRPLHESFSKEVSLTSPYGFRIYLRLSETEVVAGRTINFSAWIYNPGNTLNVSSINNWPISGYLYKCGPIAISVAKGYFDEGNVTLANTLNLGNLRSCSVGSADYYVIGSRSSSSLAVSQGKASLIDLNYTLSSSGYYVESNLINYNGVFTVIATDEWGDMLLTHFKALG